MSKALIKFKKYSSDHSSVSSKSHISSHVEDISESNGPSYRLMGIQEIKFPQTVHESLTHSLHTEDLTKEDLKFLKGWSKGNFLFYACRSLQNVNLIFFGNEKLAWPRRAHIFRSAYLSSRPRYITRASLSWCYSIIMYTTLNFSKHKNI